MFLLFSSWKAAETVLIYSLRKLLFLDRLLLWYLVPDPLLMLWYLVLFLNLLLAVFCT